MSPDIFNLPRFAAFVRERENIRMRRVLGRPAPWTNDPILSKYRFCNVNREHDTVTRWIDGYYRKPFARSPHLWFNLCIARLFNWPSTLHEIGYVDTWNRSREIDILDSCQAVQEHTGKVFTGAYIVSTNGIRMPKAQYVVERVLRPLWGKNGLGPQWACRPTCAEWADWIMGRIGFSDFLANQIVTDMKYTPILRNATDSADFCLAGPGTKRGLNRLMGVHIQAPLKQDFANELLHIVRADKVWTGVFPEYWHDLNNLSNCFCEWDKYERVRRGEGRPRSTYTPKV